MTKTAMAEAFLSPCQQSHEFEERRIPLGEETVKVGRSVARLKPATENAIFDCKVLSRNHAVIWYEDQRFYLKDTKSSNGTFVNNLRLSKGSEESPPKEVFSGDIVQFGVEIAENTKKVTHGCIVALVRLHHPDGTEAAAPTPASGSQNNISSQGEPSITHTTTSADPRDVTFSALEVYQLQQYLREAAYREQAVEAKLASLQELIARTQDASQCSWQALIDEDRLLARIEMLEGQLAIHSKTQSDDKLKEEVINLRMQQNNWESQTKESLRRALEEKMEAMKELEDVERSLNTTENECSQLRSEVEVAHAELLKVNEKHTESLQKINNMNQQIQDLEVEFQDMQKKFEDDRHTLEDTIADRFKSESDLLDQLKRSKGETTALTQQLTSVKAVNSIDKKKGPEDADEDANVQELRKRLQDTQHQMNLYRNQVDGAQKDVQNGKAKLNSMQVELERAWEDLVQSNRRAQYLDAHIRKSNDQMGAVIDLASKDLNSQLQEALYQNDRSEDLVRCLGEFATQLESRLRDVLIEGIGVGEDNGTPQVPLPIHLRHDEIMTSSDGSLPPSDPCSGEQNGLPERNGAHSVVETENQIEFLKDELAKAVQSQMLAETELKKYRDDLISARNGQRKSEEELQNVRLQLRERELLLVQSSQTVDRLNDQLNQEQTQKERLLEELESVRNNQIDYQKQAQTLEMETQQLKNRLQIVQEEVEFERSVKSTSSMNSDTARMTLHKQAARNQAEFATLKEECSVMRQRMMSVESEMKASRKDNSKLSSEHRKLQEKYRNLEKMKDAVDGNERTWMAEVCAAKVEADCTRSQLSEAVDELERLMSHRSEQDLELRGLRRRLSLTDAESLEDLALRTRTVTICSAIPLLIMFMAIVVAFLPFLAGLTATRDDPVGDN